MSRLGKLPIEMPTGVGAKIDGGYIIVNGPKGELKQKLHALIKVAIDNNIITVNPANIEEKGAKAFWGLYRSLLKNMVEGVSKGFEKKLEINGVGYKVAGGGQKLTFALGFSHPVEFELPAGINATVDGKFITVSGADKQVVGEMAAQIRKLKKPEPYKGKGIKYVDEVIRRKAGKTASK
ncbi:MAG: 50S ribosomal protein L6 [Patescibacteria group bacterium]|nr:50S ribosomal protein L6 [Patescibacteria group bacterium]